MYFDSPRASVKTLRYVYIRVGINRHDSGIHAVFVHMHAQHVGIKQLRRLKWHKNFDTSITPEYDTWLNPYRDY